MWKNDQKSGARKDGIQGEKAPKRGQNKTFFREHFFRKIWTKLKIGAS